MKLLLANSYYLENDANERKIMKPYPPLGLLYLSAWLKKAGHEVSVFDSTFCSPADFRRDLEKARPDLVGIYSNVITRDISLEMLKTARELKLPVVLGGPDPSGDGEEYLRSGALAVVRGEGEQTMEELLARIEKDGLESDFDDIPGLLLKTNGSFTDTGARDRIPHLDELPHPDRDAIDMAHYIDAWTNRHGYSSVSLITSRGCPYRCSWCSKEIFGNTYRQRSPQNVIDELKQIIDTYQPGQLWFADDVLTLNRRWILEFTRAMKDEGLATPFECLARVDRVDEEILEGLREAGCFRVWYGAESGSEKIIKAMRKDFTVEKAQHSISLTMEKGLEAGLFILIGYPGEKVADLAKTLKMIRRLKPHYCGGSVAFPLQGTPFYNEVEHLLAPDYAWSRRNENRLSFRGRYPSSFYWFAVRLLHNWSSFFSVRNRKMPWTRRGLHMVKFLVAGFGAATIGLLYELKQKIVPSKEKTGS